MGGGSDEIKQGTNLREGLEGLLSACLPFPREECMHKLVVRVMVLLTIKSGQTTNRSYKSPCLNCQNEVRPLVHSPSLRKILTSDQDADDAELTWPSRLP